MVADVVRRGARLQARGLGVWVVAGGDDVSQRAVAPDRVGIGRTRPDGNSVVIACIGLEGIAAALRQRYMGTLCGPGWGRHGQARCCVSCPSFGGIALLIGGRIGLDRGDGRVWRVSWAAGRCGRLLPWSVVLRCGPISSLTWRRWRLVHGCLSHSLKQPMGLGSLMSSGRD